MTPKTLLTPEDERNIKFDSLRNISMLGFFSSHQPTSILRNDESLMVKGKSDEDWWYLSLKNPADFDWFISNTGKDDNFVAVIDDEILERVMKRFTCQWVLSCQRLYLPSKVTLPQIKLSLSSLMPSDAEHIYSNSNFKAYTSVNYIVEQILKGPSSAYRVDGKLVGWVLTHDDTAIGLLHVLDSFRRKGIAKAIVIDLINKIRALGLTPFTYVQLSNNASMGLMESLGFVSDRPIHWVRINR